MGDIDKKLADFFKDKVVLVTGGAGTIGSGICKKILECFDVEQLRVFDNSEYLLYKFINSVESDERVRVLIGDVRDGDRLDRAVSGCDIVIHAAALKHVFFCEFNPDEAYKTNVGGTENVIDSCRKFGVERALLISTDKAVNPVNVMGTTKLLAEKLFLNAMEVGRKNKKTKFSVVRFGNVFGSNGSFVETFYNNMSNDEEILVTNLSASRYMMSIDDAINLVLRSFVLGEHDLYVLKMDKCILRHVLHALCLHFNINFDDLVIKKIGLLPGEKLCEELLTGHEKAMAAIYDDFVIVDYDRIHSHFISGNNNGCNNSLSVDKDNCFDDFGDMSIDDIGVLLDRWIEDKSN